MGKLIAALALLPGLASAADFGSLTVKSGSVSLTSACAIVPRFDMQGWGKPEVTVLVSSKALDCAQVAGWANPDSGAFDQAVRRDDGALLSVSFQPGLKLGRVSVYGVGYTLGNSLCEGCQVEAAYAGAGLKGGIKTTKPLTVGGDPIAFDVRFDMPRPAPPTAGEKLANGGEPGKAYLAYLKAYADGDYAALQKLRREGAAEGDWGYYQDAAERRAAIQSDNKPKSAKILEGWRSGNTATLIVEVPWGDETAKALVGLGFDGTGWRVREERTDFTGTLLAR